MGGASLESVQELFAVLLAFFGVDEAFHVAKEVDEGDDFEAWKFRLEIADLCRGDCVVAMGPRRAGEGEAMFEIEAEGVVSGVLDGGGVGEEVISGRGLLAS